MATRGYALIGGEFDSAEAALDRAGTVIGACCDSEPDGMELIGDFVLPPADGPASRDFQTLHFDFGLPLEPKAPGDLARFTALHVPAERREVGAVTRLVPLTALLAQRPWPGPSELMQRLVGYGVTHGAWADADGYVEGSLARIVEAADDDPVLPSVKAEPQFLCGSEFDTLAAEERFFARRGLRLDAVQIDVGIRPGELLIFDNLAVAHGRRGSRAPGELRQWVFGHRGLSVRRQRAVRDRFLGTVRGRGVRR